MLSLSGTDPCRSAGCCLLMFSASSLLSQSDGLCCHECCGVVGLASSLPSLAVSRLHAILRSLASQPLLGSSSSSSCHSEEGRPATTTRKQSTRLTSHARPSALGQPQSILPASTSFRVVGCRARYSSCIRPPWAGKASSSLCLVVLREKSHRVAPRRGMHGE